MLNDQRLEGDETATLTISSPSSGLTLGTTTTQDVAIADDETGVVNFIADTSNDESVDPSINAVLTITGSGTGTVGLDTSVSVPATDAGTGTATAADLSNAFGSQPLTFAVGDGSTINANSVTLDVNDDSIVEADQTVNLTFAGTLSSTLDGQVSEGDSALTATIDGTASGTLTFAGETQTFTVTVNGDVKVELNESFFTVLSNVVAGGLDVTINAPVGVGTITNNDSATLSIDYVTRGEDDFGAFTFAFTVTLEGETEPGFTIDYATADGTAKSSNQDYDSESDTLTFAGTPGETQIITVRVNSRIGIWRPTKPSSSTCRTCKRAASRLL